MNNMYGVELRPLFLVCRHCNPVSEGPFSRLYFLCVDLETNRSPCSRRLWQFLFFGLWLSVALLIAQHCSSISIPIVRISLPLINQFQSAGVFTPLGLGGCQFQAEELKASQLGLHAHTKIEIFVRLLRFELSVESTW